MWQKKRKQGEVAEAGEKAVGAGNGGAPRVIWKKAPAILVIVPSLE